MFKSLVSAVSEQCQEIRQALASFTYFETWGPDVIGECCRVSSVAEFPPDRIILGPDNGNSHTVYFILEGVCKMVQHMHVEIKTGKSRGGAGKGELFQCKRYRYSDAGILNSESKIEGYKSRLLNKGGDFHIAQTENREEAEECQPADVPGEELKEMEEATEALAKESEKVEEDAVNGGNIVEEKEQNGGNGEKDTVEASEEEGRNGGKDPVEGNEEEERNGEKDLVEGKEEEGRHGEKDPVEEPDLEFFEEQATEIPELKYEPDHHLKVLEECKKRRNETISVCKKGVLPEKVKNVRSVFIQIGFLLKGACFGLEKCENFIMSTTKVKCLKIPQRFLLKHNPCNIWNRIRLFHSLYLPKDDRIFENFRTDRLWTEQKKKLSEEIVSTRNLHNYTLDSDVPYSIRLVDIR